MVDKRDFIVANIKKWNTIKHIYRYQTLYKIYNKIFILTYSKPLENVNYSIEDENCMIAEINNTCFLSLKERVELHIKLLRDIYSGNVQYANNSYIQNENAQLSIFANSITANL